MKPENGQQTARKNQNHWVLTFSGFFLVVFWLLFSSSRAASAQTDAPERLDRGRFTAVFYPSERILATALLDEAARTDTFPGLPRPRQQVLIAFAPDRAKFREWAGPHAPEWGAALAFPESNRIVMQGRSSGSDAGNPRDVFRHELAHLALHEFLGDMPPRWFDEGYASYAAREWTRDDALATSLALALRGTPTLDELEDQFSAGSLTAQNAYALSYRAVTELAEMDTTYGLTRFLESWRTTGKLDRAVRETYGMTLADFERRWRQRTRRRYGALALVGDATLIGLILTFAVFPLYLARRQRDRKRMAAMVAADEAADRAARESVLDELLRGDETPETGAEKRSEPPS
jgi:hypothetical protein